MSDNKLVEYNREIQPLIRKLLEKKEALKDWAKDDKFAQQYAQEIKDAQDALKFYVKDKEATLTREIADLENDIKLAVRAAAKGTNYKPGELKAYMMARASEKVSSTITKGELFQQLDQELS